MSDLNAIPVNAHYRVNLDERSGTLSLPDGAVAIHVEVHQTDGNRTASISFDNDCKPYVWKKEKSGGSGYRYSPTYQSIIWLLKDSSGKEPTKVITASDGGHTEIVGWYIAGKYPEDLISENVITPETFTDSDGTPLLGYDKNSGAGSIEPIRFKCGQFVDDWFEPNTLYQGDIPEQEVPESELTIIGLSSEYNIQNNQDGDSYIGIFVTDRTVAVIVVLVSDQGVLLSGQGMRISDGVYISNPLNLTEGEPTTLHTVAYNINASSNSYSDYTPYRQTIFKDSGNRDIKSEILKLNSTGFKNAAKDFLKDTGLGITFKAILSGCRKNILKDPGKYGVNLDK